MKYPVGTAVAVDNEIYCLDGIYDNFSPKKCYRCRLPNRGEKVAVIVRTGVGEEARSVWWCATCVDNFFTKHADKRIETEVETELAV